MAVLEEWVDIKGIKAVCRHTSLGAAMLLAFWVLLQGIRFLLSEKGNAPHWVDKIEVFVLIGGFGIMAAVFLSELVIQGIHLLRRAWRNGEHASLLVGIGL